MDSKSTSIKILDLPCLEEADDTVTADIRGGGTSPEEQLVCLGAGIAAGIVFGGPFTGTVVAGVCNAAANEYD